MDGIISNYRRSRTRQTTNQAVVVISGVDSKEKAAKLVGKTVTWNTGKKDISGTVSGAHGNKGAVRVLFEIGIPGQALGQKVNIK
ncbi:MAG: 50S ribosomal protein L35ae [Nanoarchaeota archaeon]